MTETPSSPTDPTDADLLASLYLDGEATPEERAQVEADPELMQRVEAFAAMADDMATVTPPPDLGRLQIAAALDLFDEQQAATSAATSGTGASSLHERRERKRQRAIPTWLGAAAAVVVVVGGIAFASSLGGDQDESTAMDAAAEPAASASNLRGSDALEEAETSVDDSEAMEDEAMEDEAMEDDAMEDEASSDDAMEEDAMEDESATSPAPIPLDQFDATTAAEYFELLSEETFLPVAASPCAGSPLVEGLFGVDQFLPVVFNGAPSSLLVQEGVPATAVIVGPACEIALE